jgi:hypothetical protein
VVVKRSESNAEVKNSISHKFRDIQFLIFLRTTRNDEV